MGLDMYLYKESYVQNWDHMKPEELHQITVKKNNVDRKDIKPERISTIVEQVGYWRKFNALHAWFVTNCQDGKDECQKSEVSIGKLKELFEILGKIIKDQSLAPKLLPTQGGFFFGGTKYDEYFFRSVSQTHKLLEDLLTEEDENRFGVEYYYRASW